MSVESLKIEVLSVEGVMMSVSCRTRLRSCGRAKGRSPSASAVCQRPILGENTDAILRKIYDLNFESENVRTKPFDLPDALRLKERLLSSRSEEHYLPWSVLQHV
jgi:hypothetical protein